MRSKTDQYTNERNRALALFGHTDNPDIDYAVSLPGDSIGTAELAL